MIDIPDYVAEDFCEIATMQRGEPERVMLMIQRINPGVLSKVVEHTGDLTWRMTNHFCNLFGWSTLSMLVQTGAVEDKCQRVLRYLERDYGFERELYENLENNAEARGISEVALEHKLNQAMLEYATAHSRIPVYNDMQWVARQAAVNLGEWNFRAVRNHLYALLDHIESGEFEELAIEHHPDYPG